MFRMLHFLCIHNNSYYWDRVLWSCVESDLEAQSSVHTERWWKGRETWAFVSAHNHMMIQLPGRRRSSFKFCVHCRLAHGSRVLAKLRSWVQGMPSLLPTANWFWPRRSNTQQFPHIPQRLLGRRGGFGAVWFLSLLCLMVSLWPSKVLNLCFPVSQIWEGQHCPSLPDVLQTKSHVWLKDAAILHWCFLKKNIGRHPVYSTAVCLECKVLSSLLLV